MYVLGRQYANEPELSAKRGGLVVVEVKVAAVYVGGVRLLGVEVTVELVEPSASGQVRGVAVAEVPLADEVGGMIAASLQKLWQEREIQRQLGQGAAGDRRVDTCAREGGGARGRTKPGRGAGRGKTNIDEERKERGVSSTGTDSARRAALSSAAPRRDDDKAGVSFSKQKRTRTRTRIRTVADGVAAGVQARAGRRAHRVGVVVEELEAVCRDAVDVGRWDLRGAVQAGVVEPEVVREHEDDVRGRLPVLLRAGGRSAQDHGRQQRKEEARHGGRDQRRVEVEVGRARAFGLFESEESSVGRRVNLVTTGTPEGKTRGKGEQSDSKATAKSDSKRTTSKRKHKKRKKTTRRAMDAAGAQWRLSNRNALRERQSWAGGMELRSWALAPDRDKKLRSVFL